MRSQCSVGGIEASIGATNLTQGTPSWVTWTGAVARLGSITCGLRQWGFLVISAAQFDAGSSHRKSDCRVVPLSGLMQMKRNFCKHFVR
jgi:hypothetical protein